MIHFILYENETNINATEKNNRAFFLLFNYSSFFKKIKKQNKYSNKKSETPI
jgi:hypothetical protein